MLANSKLVQAGEAANLPMVHEVFADRAYEDNGSLVSRKKPGAVLHDASEIADRVVRMVQDGAVVSVTGKVIKMRTDTVCIHGDNPTARSKSRAACARRWARPGSRWRRSGLASDSGIRMGWTQNRENNPMQSRMAGEKGPRRDLGPISSRPRTWTYNARPAVAG